MEDGAFRSYAFSFPIFKWLICFSSSPQVLPVSYVRFSASPVLYTHTRESLEAFPLGMALTFKVHFHASTGEILHSSNSHLTFSTNRSVTKLSLFFMAFFGLANITHKMSV